jgi:hypothetical protein
MELAEPERGGEGEEIQFHQVVQAGEKLEDELESLRRCSGDNNKGELQ